MSSPPIGRRTISAARLAHATRGGRGTARRIVMALFGPYLVGDSRAYLDRLAADYL
jgi:hypothetical protein